MIRTMCDIRAPVPHAGIGKSKVNSLTSGKVSPILPNSNFCNFIFYLFHLTLTLQLFSSFLPNSNFRTFLYKKSNSNFVNFWQIWQFHRFLTFQHVSHLES